MIKRLHHSLKLHTISRREWIAAAAISFGAAFVLLLPYLLGYWLQRPGQFFTGVIMNPDDSATYFAKMSQGFDGKWLYTIPFTAEPHEPAFVGGFYIALGHLARIVDVSIATVWHGARFVSGAILFLAAFVFTAAHTRQGLIRWCAFFLAIFGSGLGWLLFLAGRTMLSGAFPIDFKMPEAHLFFSALTFPHVAAGTTLLMANYLLARLLVEEARPLPWLVILGGLSIFALGIVYPQLIFVVMTMHLLFWLYRTIQAKRIHWRSGSLIALQYLIPAPLYVYYAVILANNGVFRSWAVQSGTPSPPWPHYLIAYGVMLVLGVLPNLPGKRMNRESEPQGYLWLWIISAAVLVYSPIPAQRRFVQGVHVPLSIVAAYGAVLVLIPSILNSRPGRWLLQFRRYSFSGMEKLLAVVFVLFMSLSNLYLFADITITAAVRQPYPFFRSAEEIEALEWVDANVSEKSVFLAPYEAGNFLARYTNQPVVLGHWAETVDSATRNDEVERFYQESTSDRWRSDLLQNRGVDYVWFDYHQDGPGAYNGERSSFLMPAYVNPRIRIYRVSIAE